MTEEVKHEKRETNWRNYLLPGVAAFAIVLLIGLALIQQNSLDKLGGEVKTAVAQARDVASKLAQVDARITALEKLVERRLRELEVPLLLFYDSECLFCRNSELLDLVPGLTDQLKKDGVRLELVNLQGNYSRARELGIRRVPAFYGTFSDMQKPGAGAALESFFKTLEESAFGIVLAKNGWAAVTPKYSMITDDACSFNETARLRYFYSESCAFCKRLRNAEGVEVNPPNVTRYENVVEESLPRVKQEFGDLLIIEEKCTAINDLAENKAALGWNKSDEELCVEKIGRMPFEETKAIADDYWVVSVPTFVVDCKYVFNAVSAQKIKENICAARLDICARLRASPRASP